MADLDDEEAQDLNEPERDEHGFARADSFGEWCDINEDAISKLMQEDPWELLTKAWYGGYIEGGRFVSEVHRKMY
jgi:hypothetical protein